MLTLFGYLPKDLLETEVLEQLDDISILLLQVAVCHRKCIKPDDVADLQYEIVRQNPHIFMYFYHRKLVTKKNEIRERVASVGNLELLKFLDSTFALKNWYVGTVINAAISGQHYDCLKYLLEIGEHTSSTSVDRAFHSGNLEIVKLLAEHGFTFEKEGFTTMECAIDSRSIPCVQYLVEQGLPLKKEYVNYAIEQHRSAALEYLLSMNCPYDREHCLSYLTGIEAIVTDIKRCPADVEDADQARDDYEQQTIYEWLLKL